MIKAVLFDKDGTLFDFQATWADWAANAIEDFASGDAERVGVIAQALGFDMSGRFFDPTSPVIAGTIQEQAQLLVPHVPEFSKADIAARMVELASDAPQVEAVPLFEFLNGLRSRAYKLGVATNDAESSARAHLGKAGVVELFDFIAGYDSGWGSKPEPGQLRAFAEAVDLPPEQIAMVGDSTHDLHAARAGGMAAVGVLTGPADEATLAPFADVVLPSIRDLPDWLATHQ
ncbi:MAG: HAD family hydrolase [Pseudomonadota bacterium]